MQDGSTDRSNHQMGTNHEVNYSFFFELGELVGSASTIVGRKRNPPNRYQVKIMQHIAMQLWNRVNCSPGSNSRKHQGGKKKTRGYTDNFHRSHNTVLMVLSSSLENTKGPCLSYMGCAQRT